MAGMIDFKPHDHNPTGGLVAGQWYKVVMFNGLTEVFWAPRKLTRKQARRFALEFVGKEIYEPEDIESVRSVKRNRDGI